MDISKARELSDQELLAELVSARRHLYDLRFQLATRQLSDYSQIAQTRRSIARLLTVQTEREFDEYGGCRRWCRSRREVMSAAQARTPGKRKTKVGRVVSDKMDKTIVVSVERLSRHRLYKRVIRLTTRFKAHDERNEARIGDTVRIEESRPLSADQALAHGRGRDSEPPMAAPMPWRHPSPRPRRPSTRWRTRVASTRPTRPRMRCRRDPDLHPSAGRRQHRRPHHRVHPHPGPVAEDHRRRR